MMLRKVSWAYVKGYPDTERTQYEGQDLNTELPNTKRDCSTSDRDIQYQIEGGG
jgi:hypothetical protein